MKKFFLILMMSVCGLVANAATKYEINIAGTEVTSDNCGYIGASSDNDIKSGYAVYSPSTNTLTCYGLRIHRSGNGSYGIHNRDCAGLTIVFKDGYSQVTTADHGMNLARSTTIVVEEGSDVEIYTGSDRHALNLGSYSYYIKGGGFLILGGKNAIHGNGSGSTTVYFEGARVWTEAFNHALESFKAVFKEGADVTIKANTKMTSVNNTSMYFYGKEKILEPFGAYYSNSAIYDSSGSQVTSDDIYISDNYVAIVNQDYFPDLNFRNSILSLYPKGYINQTDVDNRTSLNISSKGIYNLTGLEYFNKLTSLDCNNNQLTSLPSLPTGIVTLYCENNKFTTLNITGKTSLDRLSAKNNTSLTSLSCPNNALTSLDVSGCTALQSLYCQNNQLASLGTLPNSLQTINCANNKFSTLTINGMSALKELYAQNNTNMTKLNCYGNALTALNVDGCTAMQELDCRFNSLTSLNIGGCTKLAYLYCSANQLTSLGTLPSSIVAVDASDNNFTGTLTITDKSALKTLNVANNPLTRLECQNNAITTLAIGGCTELSYLDCCNNKLASLDVRGLKKLATLRAYRNGMTSFSGTYCTALKVLLVCYNNLTSLDLTGCTSLSELWIQRNQIKGTAMTSLINSLRSIPISESEGLFGVYEQPSPMDVLEDNQLTTAQYMAARAKRWMPKQYNGGWHDIPLKGDVNGDGKVNVSDVTTLVNMILGTIPKDLARGDINGDGNVNVSDVTALVNIILGQN